jgi:hypothetical protein
VIEEAEPPAISRRVPRRVAWALVLLLGPATSACTYIRFMRAWHRTYGLAHYLKESAGRNALDCGTFRFSAMATAQLTPEQAAGVSDCMNRARKSKQPFFFSLGEGPVDAFVAEGLLTTPSGELRRFRYDSTLCGGHCGDRFSLEPCIIPNDVALETTTCKRPQGVGRPTSGRS